MTRADLQTEEENHLRHARKKHPDFCGSPESVIFLAAAELGEAAQEAAKRGPCWRENFRYELFDLVAVCERALLGDCGGLPPTKEQPQKSV